MSKKEPTYHDHLSLDQLQRYTQGAMSDHEMHEVESHMLVCSFCAEAFEGLDALSVDEVLVDNNKLHFKIDARLKKDKTVVRPLFFVRNWYRYAAVFAVLIVSTMIIFTYFGDRSTPIKLAERQPNEAASSADSLKKKALNTIESDDSGNSETVNQNEGVEEKEEVRKEEAHAEPVMAKPARVAADIQSETEISPLADAIEEDEEEAPQLVFDEYRKINEPEMRLTDVTETEEQDVIEKDNSIVAEEDNASNLISAKASAPIDDSSLAHSKMVGKSPRGRLKRRKKSESTIEAQPSSVLKDSTEDDLSADLPRPKVGWNVYLDYLKSALSLDPDLPSDQTFPIEVIVFIDTDGSVKKVKVKNAADEALKNKILTFITEGPGWLPAEENGIAIKQETILLIEKP